VGLFDAHVGYGCVVWWTLRKDFFFEKKKQKTFGPLSRASPTGAAPRIKVFLVLFFQKKNSFLPSERRS
jgi:hypothetical protein